MESEADKKDDASAVIVVECKAEYITIREEDYFQGYNYAAWASADFFVTTNLKETRIFKVIKGKLPKRLEEIVDIPQAEDLTNEKKNQGAVESNQSLYARRIQQTAFYMS